MELDAPENQSEQPDPPNGAPENQTEPQVIRRGRGGPRPGGGRPKGSKDKVPRVRANRRASFREIFDNETEKHAARLIRAGIRQALRGDSRMLKEWFDRVLGPATQRLEVTGPGGAPLALQAAAPVALALMSTEELRALLGLQARLGLPDVQLAPVRDLLSERTPDGAPGILAREPYPPAEPGQDESLQSPPAPLPAPLFREHLDPTAPALKPNPLDDTEPQPADRTQALGPATEAERTDASGPARAAHLPDEAPADGGQDSAGEGRSDG